MTQIVHFLTNAGPVRSLATKISFIQGPLLYSGRKYACKSTIQSEVIYLTREGDKVNNS